MPPRFLTIFLFPLLVAAQSAPPTWIPLFDGKTLAGWKETPFPRHPAVAIEKGVLLLPHGAPLTGVTYTEAFPKTNYEIRFEAARLKGGDFFASLTFPVDDTFCTWVTGGWGGDIIGLSSIDDWDASENETRAYFNFDSDHWYAFRLKVTPERIQAWIDDKPVVNFQTKGRSISLRPGDIKLSTPLGFASYNTTGGLRKIEYRLLR